MAGLANTAPYQHLIKDELPQGERVVVVESFGMRSLAPHVKALWAATIAPLLGAGPKTYAYFYFEGRTWKLHRLEEASGRGVAFLPRSILLAVVNVMQERGEVIEAVRRPQRA